MYGKTVVHAIASLNGKRPVFATCSVI
jgi:hypothetical protein